MSSHWRYLDGSGGTCGTSREFDSQEEAEAWFSGAWPKLAASGVAEVELVDAGVVSYRMSLDEE